MPGDVRGTEGAERLLRLHDELEEDATGLEEQSASRAEGVPE